MTSVVPDSRGPSLAPKGGTHNRVALLDGSKRLARTLVGNKGFGVDAMRRHGLPVPPAFAITTEVCRDWYGDPQGVVDSIWPQVLDSIAWLESETSRTFGGGDRPLLVSVRSGAALSMPGMMDTVLDLGIDDAVEAAMAAAQGSAFAADTRSRFEHMYRRIVLSDNASVDIPSDPLQQLRGAIEAVFASWNSPRAVTYRKHKGFDDLAGTAVVVQAMVFGNMSADSGTGVLFSRNPMTGANEPFGEWLAGGQGEDVVSGTFDCEPLSALERTQPSVHAKLLESASILEKLGTDVQDIEYTVEDGTLWLLQTRSAKRSAQAAVRLALQLTEEGLIDEAEALRRVQPEHVKTLLLPSLQPETRLAAPLLAKGLPACPGVVSGRAVDDVDEAVDASDAGEDIILVRTSTSPDDVHGMLAVRGIVTELGGATSHAAVVSREICCPAVVGCGDGVAAALAGKLITIDGTAGEVRQGILEMTAWSEADSPDLLKLTEMALRHSPLRAHPMSNENDHPVLDDVSPHTVAGALAEGHRDIACEHPLIAMLIAAQKPADSEDSE